MIMKNTIIIAALLLAGCVFVVPKEDMPKAPLLEDKEQPTSIEEVNPEGPWYSEDFLKKHPQYRSDMYMCSNYYAHQQKHTVPIICGPKDGECGIINCDCVCHKAK